MSAFDLSLSTAVSSKVSSYIQHLADKQAPNSSTTLRSSYTQSALERRRRRAARLRHRSSAPESQTTLDQQQEQPTAETSGPFDEPSYVSSSSESSPEKDDRTNASVQTSEEYGQPHNNSMDNQSVVSALSEDHQHHRQSYPMQVTSEAAAAWVSQTNEPIPEERSLLNDDYLSSNNFVDALIAESSKRWKSVREEVVGNTTTGKLLRQRSDETAMTHQTNLFSSLTLMPNAEEAKEEEGQHFFMQQQQAEIESLRNSFMLGHTACLEMAQDTMTEQIDYIPVEHVEVHAAHAPADDLTVWSGWTQHHSVPAAMSQGNTVRAASRPHTPYEDFPPVQGRRPDIDDASECAMPTNRRVRDLPLTMTAANGTVRKALYSGSLTESGQVTGIGILKFPETGDLYCGEIVEGEMHGQGTYTFSSSKKRKAGRVLKGQFDHNVYVGWVVHNEEDISEI